MTMNQEIVVILGESVKYKHYTEKYGVSHVLIPEIQQKIKRNKQFKVDAFGLCNLEVKEKAKKLC